jgi:L-iditol 2-dehydrogenase
MLKAKISFINKPKDLVVKEVEMPEPKPDQVLAKVIASGICGSDVECYEGKSAEGRFDLGPYTMGHEWSGQVIKTGEAVKNVKIGDKVTSDCVLACGYCFNCRSGLMPSACLNMREVGFRPDSPGGMGEYVLLEQQYIHKFPDDWSYEEGALIEPLSIGYFAVWGNNGHIDASENVVIFGAGPIGLSALIVAKAAHARVILIEPLPNRQNMARKLGADYIIDPKVQDPIAEVMKITDGIGGHLVVEASGNDKAIDMTFYVAAHSARVRLTGHSVGRKVSVELGKTIWKTLLITGAGGVKDFLPRTIIFMDRLRKEVNFLDLITHRYPFSKIHEAFEKAISDKAGAVKVMILME